MLVSPYEQGRKGWATHQPAPNPYKPGTWAHSEYKRGQEDESDAYEAMLARRK